MSRDFLQLVVFTLPGNKGGVLSCVPDSVLVEVGSAVAVDSDGEFTVLKNEVSPSADRRWSVQFLLEELKALRAQRDALIEQIHRLRKEDTDRFLMDQATQLRVSAPGDIEEGSVAQSELVAEVVLKQWEAIRRGLIEP